MTDYVDLSLRKKRMDSLLTGKICIHEESLLKICKIEKDSIENIRSAVKFYLWDCLISSNNSDIKLNDSFFHDNQENIKKLPNITPNGLLVPKKENLLSFNKLQKIVFQEFEKININSNINKVQFPVNVRVQCGSFDNNSRARASSKIHTDIWAGDPAAAITVFLHVFGDYNNIGINFFEPKKFLKNQISTLDDYDFGNSKIEEITELKTKYNDKGWIFIDPFILHQTFKKSNSLRISLDFRFIPNEIVASDTFEDENRKPYFISIESWKSFGETKLLSTNQGFYTQYNDNKFTKSYPVEIFVSDISKNLNKNILDEKKFIGKNYIIDKFNITENEFDEIFPDNFELLEYEIISNEKRDEVIESIIEKINSKDLRISGENNNDVWEKGWGEILNQITNDFDPKKLMPQYFDHHKIMRLDGYFINGLTENFVYKYDQIIKKIIIKKYACSNPKLIELGCGTGNGTLLASKILDKSAKLIASDWADKAVQIVKKISEHENREILASKFNMLDMKGWEALNVDDNSTVISFHALEQLGDEYKKLLENLYKQKCLCVHLEPIYEYYNKDNLFDTLAKNYHKKRNYLGNFLTDIKQLELEGKAEILDELRIGFGDRYHEAYGLIVWKGTG
tara:strand:+ start:2900 stop:4774 length:1875 start_codon:yes stop_codon:yes gene_type:complete